MNPKRDSQHSPEELEKFVHRALRELPPRRAPRSLEQRVLAELSRRAALPWWRQNFSHWPVPALVAFVAGSVAIVWLVLAGLGWVSAGVDATLWRGVLAQPLALWESARAVFGACTNFVEIVLRNIPPLLIYGLVAFFAATYAALFGLGAAAYRMLLAPR